MNLFVYGILLSPQILEVVTGKRFESEPAVLSDFERFAVSGKAYPAAIASKKSVIKGILLKNVDNYSLEVLDEFEGDEYKKLSIKVATKDEKKHQALVYVWNKDQKLLSGLWNPEILDEKTTEKYVNAFGH
jgi:gamma-glutamylcyclotransferase (GGCT)/AIG2-like uncharacterized protein YtfP